MPNLYTGEMGEYRRATAPTDYESPRLKVLPLVAVMFNRGCMGREINYNSTEGKAVVRATNHVWNKRIGELQQKRRSGKLTYLAIVPKHDRPYFATQYKTAVGGGVRRGRGTRKGTKKVKIHKGIRGMLQRYRTKMAQRKKDYYAKQRLKKKMAEESNSLRMRLRKKLFGSGRKRSFRKKKARTGIRARLGIGKRGKQALRFSIAEKIAPVRRDLLTSRMSPRTKGKERFKEGEQIGRKMRVNPGRLRRVAQRGFGIRGIQDRRKYKNIASRDSLMVIFQWGITKAMFGTVQGGAGFYNYAGIVNDKQRGAGRGGGRKPYARDVRGQITNTVTTMVADMNQEIMRRPEAREYIVEPPLYYDRLYTAATIDKVASGQVT